MTAEIALLECSLCILFGMFVTVVVLLMPKFWTIFLQRVSDLRLVECAN